MGPAREEDNPLHLLVVEEVVEGPETALLAVRIGRQVGIVTVNVTVLQRYFGVHSGPQGVPQLHILLPGNGGHAAVHRTHHVLQRRLLAELIALQKWDIN